MAPNDELFRIIGALQADVKNVVKTVDGLDSMLRDNARVNGDIKLVLNRVEAHQENMTEYQKRCDLERAEIDDALGDINDDLVKHDKRIASSEGFQSRLQRNALGLILVCNTLIGYSLDWFRK